MPAPDRCRLCGRVRPLLLSHILPKFVFRFQRNTSTAVIRSHQNPNRPVQDSRKLRFLCGDCEARFSAWETAFKREIYDPYHAGRLADVKYGAWLLKCAVSLSWRALKATIQEGGDGIPIDVQLAASKTEPVWRNFLLGQCENPSAFPQYLYLLEPLANTSDPNVPINFSFYIQRVGATGIWNDLGRRCIFTFCMMCSIAVVGVVSASALRAWGERLKVRRGTLQLNDSCVPVEIVEMIMAQANDHLMMSRDLSEKQKTLDRQKLLGDEQGFVRSGYARAMTIDALRAKSRRHED
jgi:hypothetical protein